MNSIPERLNPVTLPLNGNILIEASAGTGKTYSISVLFTRLILEGYRIDEILIVTFTQLATAELKNRLYQKLREIHAYLSHPTIGETLDDTFEQLINNTLTQSTKQELITRLQTAIDLFDLATIYTIHGFCQRVLTDYAFWCNVSFDSEIDHNHDKQILNLAQDYWRQHISHHHESAQTMLEHQVTPEKLAKWFQNIHSQDCFTFRLPEITQLSDTLQQLETISQSIVQKIQLINTAINESRPKLNGQSYSAKLWQHCAEVLQQIEQNISLNSFPNAKLEQWQKSLHKFNPQTIKEKIKKNQEIDQKTIETLSIFYQLYLSINQLILAKKNAYVQECIHAFQSIHQQLITFHHQQNKRSFHDLLVDLDHALSTHNPYHQKLIHAISDKWKIALIDEFQDTDPIQYRIFKTLFSNQSRPLLMIGDPKQSIYRFRGADIHAYLQAVTDTIPTNRYTLATNWRSHQRLIQSIGYLFQQNDTPFVFKEIPYIDVDYHRQHSLISPEQPAILIRWLCQSDESSQNLPSVATLSERAANWCAKEVASLIAQGNQHLLHIDQEPLQAKHIAILVNSHSEGTLITHALKKYNIPSVSLGKESVFNTEEAKALSALLQFWQHPRKIELLRFVLCSQLFHYTAQEIHHLNTHEDVLNQWIQQAQSCLLTWQKYGIFSAIQQFCRDSNLEKILLINNQERTLTNFWQLAELLAQAEYEYPSPHALQYWFNQQIMQKNAISGENAQLRLESDDALVKIMTIHASKGLEFPIVLLPFLWHSKSIQKIDEWQNIQHHQVSEIVHESLLTESDTQCIQTENLSEQLRLYYVALTRAQEQLIIYAGATREWFTSNPLAYLFNVLNNQDKNAGLSKCLSAWRHVLNHSPISDGLAWLSQEPETYTVSQSLNTQPRYQAIHLKPRQFLLTQYSSFSALTSHTSFIHQDETSRTFDHHELCRQKSEPLLPPENTILAFPQGANAGICLHTLLEKTDLNRPAIEQTQLYAPTLAQHGFHHISVDSLIPMIDNVRHTEIWTHYPLSSIQKEYRLPEMGFTLKVHNFQAEQIKQWFQQPNIQLPEICVRAAQRLDFNTINGFLNGFIDLVCQNPFGQIAVIDYKSNHLGNRIADYHPDAMSQEIAVHHYYLQALIYSIATARYLQTQNTPLPSHINVRYLFLRGLNPNNHHGIWCWDIPLDTLKPWLE